ncbi:MAG: glycosyltransferase, partial [Phycisphaerae bacterium]|nr:glycosyltransferase [Phycisphaerae bacterium]
MQNDLSKIIKPIDKPQHISLLIATRGRPEYLDKVFDSIGRTVGNADGIDVWIYVDNDDDITNEYISSKAYLKYPFKINWVLGERTLSMGQMANILRQKCTTNPGIYMTFVDDYILTSNNWDGAIRDTFNRYSDGIVLGYIPDPHSGPEQVTITILSAQWTNVTGKIFTEFFPFWYDDTWLDQVSQMVQRKTKIEIGTEAIGGNIGKTPRLKNLPFWNRFFNNLMDKRLEDANLLLKAIYPQDCLGYQQSVKEAERLAKSFTGKKEKVTKDYLLALERAHSSFPENPEPHLILLHLALETKAVSHLCDKADSLIQAGDFSKALKMLDNIALAEHKYKNINYLRAVYLKRLGRTKEASGAAIEELILQPEHKASQEIYRKSDMHQLFSSGLASLSEGKISEALTHLEQVKHFYSRIPNLNYAIATAYFQLGDIASARQACEAELKLQPEHDGAKRLLERIEKAINEYEQNNNKATNVQVKPIDRSSASDSIQIDDTKRKRTGIIVFGHSRPLLLRNLLESLRRQGTTNDIHVWLDGHHGRSSFIEPTTKCRELVQKEFQEVHLTAMNSNMGIEKLTIDGLSFMSSRYKRIIVLEDDCFPTANAIAEFEQALDEIATRPEVYSVYGHHFLTETEGETITRFQGWGWATTREKLLPVLAEMKRCFAMAEPDYLRWVHQNLTPEVIRRLDVTPGRNCVRVIASFFCWDGCTCLVTAIHGLVHKKTRKRVIYNCGMGDGSTHFPQNDKFRLPPFNMITPQEVWSFYDSPPKQGSHSVISRKVELPQITSPRATARTSSSTATFPGHKSQARQTREMDHKEHLETQIVVDGLIFTNVKRTKHLNNSVGFNDKYIIKIEHEKHPLKLRSLQDEIEIIKHLNSRECVSCPRLLSEGSLKTGERYFIQERVEHQRGFNTADMLFSILEQKNFGICEGDLKRENLIFDSNSVCYIIDYDQAIYDERFVRMGNVEYLDWFAQFFADRWKRFGHTDFYKWGGYDKNEIFGLFKNDSFNLTATTLFKEQVTTDTKSGIYHTLRTDKVYIDGARDLNPRLSALNTIEFKKGESILDVGCNMGLLGHYLHDRGCRVTGIDMDGKIIIGAKMVANILNKDIQFKYLDLDTEKIETNYDTICLFSVIHHVKNFKQITENIAQTCNRIILECKLKEHGSKPIGGNWTDTSGWEFNSLQELVRYFEVVFKGFKFQDFHGKVDRDREIISFAKKYAATAIQIQSKSPTDIQENKFIVPQSDNKSEYLVSAVVSTYNSERFIRGCLEDLEKQTIAEKLEIIIVNSGSQQNEEAIVREFLSRYDNIKYIRTEERETIYKAWNRAIKVATGKYITNANTDDRHRENALEKMAKTLDENPDKALVYANQLEVNEIDGRRVVVGERLNGEFSRARLFEGECPPGSQPMWRRDVHEVFGYFDESFTISGDYEFWFRLTQKFDFLYLNEVLGERFIGAEAISQSNDDFLNWENELVIHKCHKYAIQEEITIGATGISEHPVFSNRPEVNIWKQNTKAKLKDRQISLCNNIKANWDFRTSLSPKLTVVIVTYNRHKDLLENLYALNEQNEEDFEVIVVDNGGDLSWLRQHKDEFKFGLCGVELNFNFGPSPARNIGTKFAKAEYIAFLDDDVVSDKDLVRNIVEHFKNHNISGLRGKVLPKSQAGSENIPVNYDLGNQIITTACEVSCLSAFRKDILVKMGGFDELLFGPEGMELSYRICKSQKEKMQSILYFP